MRHLLLIFLIIFSMPQVVMADGIEDVEATYNHCLEKAGGTTYGMRECAHEHADNLKNHLGKVWQALFTKHSEGDKMPDEHKNAILLSLQEEQKKWEEYEKIACRNLADTVLYGTAGFIYANTCNHLVITQRIEILLHELCAETSPDDAPDDCRAIFKE